MSVSQPVVLLYPADYRLNYGSSGSKVLPLSPIVFGLTKNRRILPSSVRLLTRPGSTNGVGADGGRVRTHVCK